MIVSKNGVTITSWKECDFANLGRDGKEDVNDSGGKYHYEYRLLLGECSCISGSNYNRITGQKVNIKPGHFATILTSEENSNNNIHVNNTKLTNMITHKTLNVSFQGYFHYDMMANKFYILNDQDYAAITKNLTNEWQEKLIYLEKGMCCSSH
mgnify:CR=1 FL=1